MVSRYVALPAFLSYVHGFNPTAGEALEDVMLDLNDAFPPTGPLFIYSCFDAYSYLRVYLLVSVPTAH